MESKVGNSRRAWLISDRRLHRMAWLPVLLVGLGLFVALRQTLLATGNANLLPALVLIGTLVVPVAFVTFIAGSRVDVHVTSGALAATAVCGGVVAVVVAGLLEFDALRHLGPAAILGVAVIEEAAKLIVPLLLLVYGPWRAVGDGLALGIASGAGFAVLETAGYTFVTAVNTHGSLPAIDDVLAVRGVLSPAGHMLWTGMCTAMLWTAASARFRGWRCLSFIATLGLAVGLHALWDGVGTPWSYGLLAGIGAVALSLISHATQRMSLDPPAPRDQNDEDNPKTTSSNLSRNI